MKLKKIVKIMNFQTLLNINSATKKADKYQDVGKKITDILTSIIYNKNLILDKNALLPNKNNPKLNIYIANDFGFCGNFNSSIRRQIEKDKDDFKIIIGKKIIYNDEKVLLKITKEEFHNKVNEIEKTISNALDNNSYSEINVYYNHYYSFNEFDFIKLQLFPVEFEGKNYDGHDFTFETDVEKLLKGILSFYISYQIKMAEENSVASENVLRNQITSMALDRIEIIEEEEKNEIRKAKLHKTILSNVENYKKILENDLYE